MYFRVHFTKIVPRKKFCASPSDGQMATLSNTLAMGMVIVLAVAMEMVIVLAVAVKVILSAEAMAIDCWGFCGNVAPLS